MHPVRAAFYLKGSVLRPILCERPCSIKKPITKPVRYRHRWISKDKTEDGSSAARERGPDLNVPSVRFGEPGMANGSGGPEIDGHSPSCIGQDRSRRSVYGQPHDRVFRAQGFGGSPDGRWNKSV